MDNIEYWRFDGPDAKKFTGKELQYEDVYWLVKRITKYGDIYYRYQDIDMQERHQKNINASVEEVFSGEISDEIIHEYFTRVL